MAILPVKIIGAAASLNVDTDKLPDDIYREAMLQGLRVMINRGHSRVEPKTAAGWIANAKVQRELLYQNQARITNIRGHYLTLYPPID